MSLPTNDVFTETSNTALTSHTAGGITWVNNNGTHQVIATSDTVRGNSSGTENCAHDSTNTYNDNQYAQVKLAARSSNPIGPAVRCHASANTYYGFYLDSTASYLFKVVSGTWTQIGSNGSAGTDGNYYRLEVNGTTLTPKYSTDGTTWNTWTSIGAQTDNSIASGYAGICSYGISGEADNFVSDNLSTSTTLTVADGAVVTQSDAVTLTQVHAITVNDGAVVTQADNITLTMGGVDLVVQDAASVTQADAFALTQVHNLTVVDGAVVVQADAITLSTGNIETFEAASGWIVETDTSGTGSTVARDNGQAYAGTYSAKCFTTNSGAKAQVRDVISSTWAGVPSSDPGEYVWQHAYIYVPTATANALTGSEYLDLAGFYVNSSSSGWYLRLKASAGLYAEGPSGGTQHEFNLYGTLPLDQWVELEICLWSQNIEAGGRSFLILVNGTPYGWFRLGATSTNYDRVAMGILNTNSTDDLTVYVDNWQIFDNDTTPNGTDNRKTELHTTFNFTSQAGAHLDSQYATWKDAGASYLDATHGLGGFRSQYGVNTDLQRDNLDDGGWAEIVLDWTGGVEPSYPPSEIWGTYYFAAMVAFKKYFPDEENLEIVFLYDYNSSGTTEMVYESWGATGSLLYYSGWQIPVASVGSGKRIPEPGDKILVRWEKTSATQLNVKVSYYDASASTWYQNVINDTRTMTSSNGVNWLDGKHDSVSVTTETTKYSVRSIEYGTTASYPFMDMVVQDGFSSTQADNVTLTQTHVLVVNDGVIVSQADTITVNQAANLTVADAAIVSQSDNASLTQTHILTVLDGAIVTQADAPTLAQTHVLVVQDGYSITQSDIVTLTGGAQLVVQNAAIVSQSDNTVLVQAHGLSVNNGYSQPVADFITIIQEHILQINDGYIVLQSDAIGSLSSVVFDFSNNTIVVFQDRKSVVLPGKKSVRIS